MNLRNMIIKIQSRLDDSAYWDDDRIKAIINQVKDTVAQEMVFSARRHYTLSSVADQTNYGVPAGFMSNELLFYGGDYDNEIEIVSSPRAIQLTVSDPTQSGQPRMGYFWGSGAKRELVIYPTFDTDGISMDWWFWGFPEDVDGDNDELSFPVEWHPSIVKLSIAECKKDDEEINIAEYMIIEQKEIRTIKSLRTHTNSETMSDKTMSGFDEVSFGQTISDLPFTGISPNGNPIR